jgi:hypothetical protein
LTNPAIPTLIAKCTIQLNTFLCCLVYQHWGRDRRGLGVSKHCQRDQDGNTTFTSFECHLPFLFSFSVLYRGTRLMGTRWISFPRWDCRSAGDSLAFAFLVVPCFSSSGARKQAGPFSLYDSVDAKLGRSVTCSRPRADIIF